MGDITTVPLFRYHGEPCAAMLETSRCWTVLLETGEDPRPKGGPHDGPWGIPFVGTKGILICERQVTEHVREDYFWNPRVGGTVHDFVVFVEGVRAIVPVGTDRTYALAFANELAAFIDNAGEYDDA